MRPETTFSVIIPTHERPEFLASAVASVLRQTIQDFEIVVVDDASGSAAEVPSDPRIRLVRRSECGGPAVARNTGLDEATGRYVCFLDDDDVYSPDRLALALQGLADAPVAVCFSAYLHQRRDVQIHARRLGANRLLDGDVSWTILDGATPSLGRTAVRRELVPRFDPRWTAVEDTEWWLRLARRLPVRTVPKVGYLVRLHDGERGLNDARARLDRNLEFLDAQAAYFRSAPEAAAFRWRRVGLLAERLGEHQIARGAFVTSLRCRPAVATSWHAARSMLPPATSAWLLALRQRVGR